MSGDHSLQPGDVFFKLLDGKTIGGDGEPRRLADYKFKNERSAQDGLKLSSGLLPTALKASDIERIDARHVTTIVNIDLYERGTRHDGRK